ncbi:MAG: MGMT family protein [Desulfobulbaceae bacterium]|nr:MGMT family protein [Desulfobulbaceae bacterium]MCK5436743.1 MGMT family protein [Desulfobulbaceae bacterium]MCK5543653.1 MGMT family protein [Desulfobulbaceae bacterium]
MKINKNFKPKQSPPSTSRPLFAIMRLNHCGVTIYFITSGQDVIHVAFSKKSQDHAVTWLKDNFPEVEIILNHPKKHLFQQEFEEFETSLETGFKRPSWSPFLDKGTEFQKKVWALISTIPFSETRTYGELAVKLGSSGYSRAVGQACNKNPLPLIIPCHRVIGSTGLGGFSGGISIKKRLLDIEQEVRKSISSQRRQSS